VPIYRLGHRVPQIDPSAFVHETAILIGAVVLGPQSSVWPNAVLRADNEPIVIGAQTNVQDGCVLHADPGLPLHIGSGVSVGHMTMLHGCTIGDGTLIGIGAIVLNEAVVGRNCLIGAGALVTERKQIGEASMMVGAPARLVRHLEAPDIERLAANAQSYVRRIALFQAEQVRIG
jgi:carbonic anhydrase/acetyltransferase-like protein (isoleucine patch superfamily)